MAGVIAHNRAIDSSANARALVTFISVARFLTFIDDFSLQRNDVSSAEVAIAVTGITTLGTTGVSIALKGETSNEVSKRRGRFAGRC